MIYILKLKDKTEASGQDAKLRKARTINSRNREAPHGWMAARAHVQRLLPRPEGSLATAAGNARCCRLPGKLRSAVRKTTDTGDRGRYVRRLRAPREKLRKIASSSPQDARIKITQGNLMEATRARPWVPGSK